MELSILILSLSVMCLTVCQPRAVTSHTDLTWLDKHDDGINDRKYPKAEDYNKRISSSAARQSLNKAFHPYGLDTLGQGNII